MFLLLDFYNVEPAIQERSPHKVNSGEQVSIQCSAKSLTAVKLVWIGPTGDVIVPVKQINSSFKAADSDQVFRVGDSAFKNQSNGGPERSIQTKKYPS
jgi:hypothetical protein